MAALDHVLVPVDGSENSDRAVRYAIALLAPGGTLHLINVRPPLGGGITTFLAKRDVESYHREEGDKALASALAIAREAGVAVEPHIAVGRAGALVAEFAERCKAGLVVMGTRGHTGLAGILMGSVAQDVLARSAVPVCLVK
jgi:nucleotide-binding universal stress UspA family protein